MLSVCRFQPCSQDRKSKKVLKLSLGVTTVETNRDRDRDSAPGLLKIDFRSRDQMRVQHVI